MTTLMNYLAVGCAGFLGAITRLLVATMCGKYLGETFPTGTMIINLSGSLFLGWFVTAASSRMAISHMMKLAIATGFVGAYTTFSTFMYESAALLGQGDQFKAWFNLVGSLVLGLAAVRFGIWLGGR